MNFDLVLFCKTYKGDLDRFNILYKSILKHNVDTIPFFISVPDEDYSFYKKNFLNANVIKDSSIVDTVGEGWRSQQLIKSTVYRLNLSEFYVCIDSDSYFIKDFRVEDFMYDKDIPYMVMHDNKELFEITDVYGKSVLGFDPKVSFTRDYDIIKSFFNRNGKTYHFGPTPCIWRSSIWKYLDTEYGLKHLFSRVFAELKWYGEAVLYMGYPYMPTGPLFKCMHYELCYDITKQIINNEEMLSQNYMGVVMQSNWGAPLKY